MNDSSKDDIQNWLPQSAYVFVQTIFGAALVLFVLAGFFGYSAQTAGDVKELLKYLRLAFWIQIGATSLVLIAVLTLVTFWVRARRKH